MATGPESRALDGHLILNLAARGVLLELGPRPPFAKTNCLFAGLGAPRKPLVSPVSDRRIPGRFKAGPTEGTFPFFSCNPTHPPLRHL